MTMENYLRTRKLLALAGLVVALSGCGGGGEGGSAGSGDVELSVTRAMTTWYSQYLQAHGDQPPPNEQALRDYLASKQEGLERAGLTVDKIFTSPRNGQPLVWVYAKTPPNAGELGRCFAYEKTPTDGKRLVLADGGRFEIMEDAKFRTLFPNTP